MGLLGGCSSRELALIALIACSSCSNDSAARGGQFGPGAQQPSTPFGATGGAPATAGAGGAAPQSNGGSAGSQGAGGAAPAQGSGGSALPGSGGSAAMSQPDAGHAMQMDAAVAPVPATATSLRVSDLLVRDPHIFVNGTDITDDASLGTSLNGSLIKNSLTMDYDMDGVLDTSILPILTPLDPSAQTAQLDLIDARCASAAMCQASASPGLAAHFAIENHAQGSCLEPMAGTTSSFTPAVTVPMAPCFVTTESRDMTLTLAGIKLALTAAKVAARYDGNPPTQLVDGLIMGFLTDAAAMQALLPSWVLLYGGMPLSGYMRAQDRDAMQSPNGESGFWLYINFTAVPVTYPAQ